MCTAGLPSVLCGGVLAPLVPLLAAWGSLALTPGEAWSPWTPLGGVNGLLVPLTGGVCGEGLGGFTVDLLLALVPILVLWPGPLVVTCPVLCPMLVPGSGLVVDV